MMKKTVALLLAVVMIVLVFAGCSGKKDNTIPAAAFYTENVLSLPMKTELNSGDYLTYGGHQFQSKTKLDKMAKQILRANDDVQSAAYTNAYGKCWLFTAESTGGKDSWCLYQQDPANTKNLYIFSGMHRELNTVDGVMDLLLPLHLISDSYIRDNMGSRLELDAGYSCGAEKVEASMQELFRAFYQESGLYSVSDSENGFVLMPNQGMRLELQFSFTQRDDTDWFTISDITYREPVPTENVTVRWVDESGSPINVTPNSYDALQMSSLLISLPYGSGTAMIDYPYAFDLDGEVYMARLIWENDTWSGTAAWNGQTAALSSREAAELAALLWHCGVVPTDESAAEDVGDVTPLAVCMTTTNEVNVRSKPGTDGERIVIMPNDAPMAVVGEVNGWYQILFGGRLAYMSGDYLRTVS